MPNTPNTTTTESTHQSMYTRISDNLNIRMADHGNAFEPSEDEISICYLLMETAKMFDLLSDTQSYFIYANNMIKNNPTFSTEIKEGFTEIIKNNENFLNDFARTGEYNDFGF